ncbi:signal peptidase I [Bowmanella sp. JS7-9]|uniref:Signal peptidase I n=1 Tax=Pseudobowmanella zhangzhouensis TaxID=1537679 RepID=A0ABW1XQ05_9ALTE|nr:signal peptidase I [Bowmanella sp. JS7-9]
MHWKPKGWIAIIVGIIFQPFVFLYVNRPRLFWCYFCASIVVTFLDYLLHGNLVKDSIFEYTYLSWLFIVICPIHAYKITKSYDSNQLRNWYTRWWAIPCIYAAYFIPIFLFRAFLFEPFNISASSMSPTLNVGDHLIVKKWGFGGYSTYGIDVVNTDLADEMLVQRGHIYVFYPPKSINPYVKRVIGLPGDLIEIREDIIYVNGNALLSKLVSESANEKIFRETFQDNSYLIQRLPSRPYNVNSTIRVPEHHYFFLGDNRDNSADSRIWGTISGKNFVGEVIYVF